MSVNTDVLIVGGGMIGSACARELTLAGREVTVVEPEGRSGQAWQAAAGTSGGVKRSARTSAGERARQAATSAANRTDFIESISFVVGLGFRFRDALRARC